MLLLVLGAALIAIVTAGGWTQLQGMHLIAILYVIAYLVLAVYVARWRRGALPFAAGLAVLFTVVAAVAAPAWFARAQDGFAQPALDPTMLGILTAALVPVQILLVAFAMRGVGQRWNEEVEVPLDAPELGAGSSPGG